MTIMQMAVLLMRLFGVYLFFDVVIVLTELPVLIFGILNSRFDNMTSERILTLIMVFVRLFVYAGAGVTFLVFARPLAKLFTKGLENV